MNSQGWNDKVLEIDLKATVNKLKSKKPAYVFKGMISSLRSKIYRTINLILPRFMKLNVVDHDKIIKKMQALKADYAKTNQVEDIQSNMFKLSLIIAVCFFLVPEGARALWMKSMNDQVRAIRNFIKKSFASITNLSVDDFFNNFYLLAKNYVEIFVNLFQTSASAIDSTLATLLYTLSTLFIMELACLAKIIIIDAKGEI